MTRDSVKDAIREQALATGFDAVGFSSADIGHEAGSRFDAFLENGFHGDMDWLAAKADRRRTPQSLWPEAKTVIVLAANYGPDHNPLDHLTSLRQESRGNISVYARNLDYHDILKKRLKRVGRWMCDQYDCDVKVFVDTAPVLEKPIGQKAGIGWQGKHTNLVSRQFGSWLFLAEIYTTLDLTPSEAETDHCGSCRKCLDICPTNAFPEPYKLDARKCISYLTIEHKGHISRDLRPLIGTRIYGCDDCLSVCPWNKYAVRTDEVAFLPRDGFEGPRLAALAKLDDTDFRRYFRKSPIKRTGRDRFLRNTLIAIGNTGDVSLSADVQPLLSDASPLVRAMAVWALGRLLGPTEFATLRDAYSKDETDQDVQAEWRHPDHATASNPSSVSMR